MRLEDLPIVDSYLDDPLEPCEMNADCLASPEAKGEAALCRGCKWTPSPRENARDCYRVEKGSRVHFGRKEDAEHDDRRAEVAAKRSVKLGKSSFKRRLGKKAERAEVATTRSLVKSTRNSGRTNKDGDHNFADRISIDTKLQTGNINPVVNLAELTKIQVDARRVGNPIGVLELRNKNNVAVVVMSEADWRTILDWLSTDSE